MSTAQTTTQIIATFDTLTDNLSELGSDAKLALFNRKYRLWQNIRDWELLRKEASVAVSAGYIQCPTDFKNFVDLEEGKERPYNHGFYIGANFYPIIRLSERKRFPDMCYFDPVTKRIMIPSSLSLSGTATFDYYHTPDDLVLGATIAYMMAIEHYSIDQSEQGRTKEVQYTIESEKYIEDMEYEDNQLKESWLNYA
jgi:hypothetical protein